MSRTVPAALLTALSSNEVQPFYAVEFLFDSGTVRLWTGYGERTIESNTYTGAGTLMAIEAANEVSDMAAKSMNITLSGATQEIVSLALQEPYQRRKCRVLFGVVSVDDVIEVFSGSVSDMPIQDSAESGTITVLADSKLVEAGKASNLRYTSETQKSQYPADTFFDYVSAIQDAEIVWGRKDV